MSSEFPLISVVIPTFNRAHLVTRAIDSVLSQTYGNVELLVVDDGSVDDTEDRVRAYGARLRYLRQGNQGTSVAKNLGIAESKGDWVAFLDSDDTWSSTKLEVQMAAISSLGDAAGGCFTNVRFVGQPTLKDTAFSRAGYPESFGARWVDDPLLWILAPSTIFFVQSLLVRRSLMEGSRWFDRTLRTSEDTDFCFRLALRTRLCTVPEALVDVDAAPHRADKLSRIVLQDRERNFQVQDHVLAKWLQILSEDSPEGWWPRVVAALRHHRYDELLHRLKRGQLIDALRLASKLRALGETPADVLRAVLGRTGGRLR